MSGRPALGRLLKLALALGVGSGLIEVGLRARPRFGLSAADVGWWLGASAGLGAAFLIGVGTLAWAVGRRPYGALVGALVFVHSALIWRFGYVVNAFVHETRVWAPLLGMAVGALALAYVADRAVDRFARALSRLAWVGGLAMSAYALASSRPAAVPRDLARDNVVLITLDTTRADRLSAYGSKNPTPAFDRVAQEGALFLQTISTAPLTQPSHLAILTGDPPHITGVVSNGTQLPDAPGALPVVLKAHGWTTAAFVSGFPLHGRYGWTRGFDVYDDDFGALAGLHRLSLVSAWDQLTLPAHTLRERQADATLQRALPWLSRHADRPFFLWVHLFDAHGPYEAPGHPWDPPTDGEPLALPGYWPPRDRAVTSTDWLIGAYEAEVRYADAAVGRILTRLETLGVLNHTLVVVTADHGESLTEHGTLFEHGDDLYDPSLKVPLAIRYPAAVTAGTRIPCQTSTLDITPTVLAMLRLSDGISRQGIDRSMELRGLPCRSEPVVATTVGARTLGTPPVDHALRTEDWKLYRKAPRSEGGAEDWTLYHLSVDPGEKNPLSELGAPDVYPRLSSTLMNALQGATPTLSTEADAQTEAALQALGYLQ